MDGTILRPTTAPGVHLACRSPEVTKADPQVWLEYTMSIAVDDEHPDNIDNLRLLLRLLEWSKRTP